MLSTFIIQHAAIKILKMSSVGKELQFIILLLPVSYIKNIQTFTKIWNMLGWSIAHTGGKSRALHVGANFIH